MAPSKSNDFLDAGSSGDDASDGYNSEAEQLAKGGRVAKRRRLNSSDEDEADNDTGGTGESEDEGAVDGNRDVEKGTETRRDALKGTNKQHHDAPEDEDIEAHDGDDDDDDDNNSKRKKPNTLPKLAKPLSKTNLVQSDAAIKRSGVIYLSRIPPFMKPHKLRSLLSPYGTINRIFLSPEDPGSHQRRVRGGGNKKKMFTEGWMEFTLKRDAKRVCELLNARTIGGKKGTFYRDDIWNLLYLKGFKWFHLTAQITAEQAERSGRMMAEMSKTNKENKEYVRNVEKAKMLDGIQSKREGKKRKVVDGDGNDDDDAVREALPPKMMESRASDQQAVTSRPLRQISAVKKKKNGSANEADQVSRVLGKIF